MIELLQLSVLSPVVLAFGLGVVAALARSDLRIPAEVHAALSIYLLLAIGLKGGAELTASPLALIWRAVALAVLVSALTPLPVFAVLRRAGGFATADAAAIAAHYGSVSIVTVTAALAFLDRLGVPYEGFMPALVAVMEVPGIVVALALARRSLGAGRGGGAVIAEILAGRSIVLLLGGLAIGVLTGPAGLAQVAPFFVDPFRGVLVLFLLELGIAAAARLRDLRRVGPFLIAFGLLAPLALGIVGLVLGRLAGLSPGGSVIFAVLAASASYIAAPAAVRLALPQANPTYYLTLALGVTFPFNLVAGIPLYHAIGGLMERGW